MQKDEFPCPMATTATELRAYIVRAPGHDSLCLPRYLSGLERQWAGLGQETDMRRDECMNSHLPSQQNIAQ